MNLILNSLIILILIWIIYDWLKTIIQNIMLKRDLSFFLKSLCQKCTFNKNCVNCPYKQKIDKHKIEV